MNSKQNATFVKLVAGHGMLFKETPQSCQFIGLNQDGEAIIARTLVSNPNRQYRYIVNAAGKIIGRPL